MKLFMEISPQLFDECSHDYTEMQNTAEQRQMSRKSKWDVIAEQAKRRQGNGVPTTPRVGAAPIKGINAASPMRAEEVDPMTQDSQKRLDALKLQDEVNSKDHRDGKDRRPKEHTRTTSVGSSRSQR